MPVADAAPRAGALRRAAEVVACLPPGEPFAVTVVDGVVTVATDVVDTLTVSGAASFGALDALQSRGGFWVGWIAYDLGRAVERVARRAASDRALPDVGFVRFGSRTVLTATGPRRLHGRRVGGATRTSGQPPTPVALGPMRSSLSRDEHRDAVGAVKDLLRAGDCYQVNLTRRLTSPLAADPRALLGALVTHNPAAHTLALSAGGVSIVSASPERYLRVDGGAIETAPIKGTHIDAAALRASEKDAAEHVMIVDLARNDLGRVAVTGTVRVAPFAAIESFPGLHHMVSRVHAVARPGTTLGDLVRATFPPASVTGAPKPRVLQAIEDLEPVRRDVYCGAVGWIDADRRRADLAVAIRTFTITGAGTDLGVGGGIVADSDPDSEWRETELKAARLLRAAGAHEVQRMPEPARRAG